MDILGGTGSRAPWLYITPCRELVVRLEFTSDINLRAFYIFIRWQHLSDVTSVANTY